MNHWSKILLVAVAALRLASFLASANYLTEDSVVLITGAAGFIGSELSLALFETYKPKKIICVDSMDQGFGLSRKTDKDLALFEFKRQRVFRMLQTIQQDVHFYRVDFRPSIPEFYDTSEVPILNAIFQDHPDITHVVHLADHVHRSMNQGSPPVIPRVKGQGKAGMMEAILEQINLHRNTTGIAASFVYASSGEVYDHFVAHEDKPNHPPFAEDKPISTSSTEAGTSKMLDEMLAQIYHDRMGIGSVGLRFFHVYGPWGLSGSATFEMAEKVAFGNDPAAVITEGLDNIHDFVYISDAVDAIMAAMQVKTANPIVFNVGSGHGTSLRELAQLMRGFVPSIKDVEDRPVENARVVSYADLTRSSTYLGFEPQVSLQDGLQKLLSWHFDRAYPYGSGSSVDHALVDKGIVACDKYDTECLQGTPIFPCASECSHPRQCKNSLYDDVIELTRTLTAGCDSVMYTVDLDDHIETIPSTFTRVSSRSKAFVSESPGSHCNLAFVAYHSPLYKSARLKANAEGVVKHGFWTLIPIAVTEFSFGKRSLLSLLPKLSPGLFFPDTVEKALYVDPNVVVEDLPRLLNEIDMQPSHPTVQGATLLLVGKSPVSHKPAKPSKNPVDTAVVVQTNAYRMVRIAVINELLGDGFTQQIDSRFLLHKLQTPDDDGRLFRCDILGEVMQWNVPTDTSAIEFIVGLHDMWSRIMVGRTDMEPWWVGDKVESIPVIPVQKRRLQEVSADEAGHGDNINPVGGQEDEEDGTNSDTEGLSAQQQEHNGFGVVQEALQAVFGLADNRQEQRRFESPDKAKDADDFVIDDDDTTDGDGLGQTENKSPNYRLTQDQDPRSDDIWMGILSSTSTRYFSRLVSAEAAGVHEIPEEGSSSREL